MSLVSIFINKFQGSNILRATASGKVVYIPIDCITEEAFKIPAEITNHPVEKAPDVSDHIILRPKTLTIEGYISETPLNLAASLQGAVTAVGGALGQTALSTLGKTAGIVGSLAGSVTGGIAGKSLANLLLPGQSSGNRLGTAVDELTAARDSRAPVEIQTGLRKYPSGADAQFYIKDVEVKRNKSTGQAILVQVTFQEVQIAQSVTVAVNYPKTPQGVGTKGRGSQTSTPLSGTSLSNGSVLSQGFDSLRQALGNK